MYSALINGKEIDLGDVQISMRLKNPMFDPNMGMDSTASYPFKLPVTPKNMAILGFPGRLTKPMPYQNDFPFEHRFGAIQLPGTQIRILKVTESEIEAYIKIGRSEFLSTTKDKTLQDLAFPEVVLVDHAIPDAGLAEVKKWLVSTEPLEYPATFPMVKNLGLFGASNFAEVWWKSDGPGPYQNAWTFEGIHWADDIHSCPDYYRIPAITPMPWLCIVIEQIFDEADYTIISNEFFTDEVLRKLCIYNPVIVRYKNSIHHEIKFNLNHHLPKLSITSFLSTFRVPFGIDTYFHHIRKEVRLVSRDSIITSMEEPVDFSERVSKVRTVFIELASENFTFSMQSDPNDVYWQKTMLMSSKQCVADPASVMYFMMLPSDQLLNSVCLVIDENWWYVYLEDENNPGLFLWTRFAYNWQDAVLGTGEVKFEAPIAPLPTITEPAICLDGALGDATLPVVDLRGNQQMNPIYPGEEYSEFSLRLLFCHGVQKPSPSNYFYVYASSLFPTLYATPDSQPFDMSWRSPGEVTGFPQCGLYQTFWKNWIEWRQRTTQVEIQKQMSASELSNLDFTKKHKINEAQFILDELNFTVTLQSIQVSKIKAWTV